MNVMQYGDHGAIVVNFTILSSPIGLGYDSVQYLVEEAASEPRAASRVDLPGDVLDADWSRAAVIESGFLSFPLSDVFSLYVTTVPEVSGGASSLLALGTLAASAMRPFRRPPSR